jgi:hypothetical protein
VIIVDDRLALEALAGRLGTGDQVATTWSFHYRLVRALADTRRTGRLSSASAEAALSLVVDPPVELLQVLDPRAVTQGAAQLATRHGLNVLAAELVASAVHYRADVHLSSANVVLRWADVMAAEGVDLTIS